MESNAPAGRMSSGYITLDKINHFSFLPFSLHIDDQSCSIYRYRYWSPYFFAWQVDDVTSYFYFYFQYENEMFGMSFYLLNYYDQDNIKWKDSR